jgi:hypothetical protein
MKNLLPFLNKVKASLEVHRAAEAGGYRRRLLDPAGAELYGTSDAAIIQYTIGELPEKPEERQEMIQMLQSFQDTETGLFTGAGHHPIHATAFAISALELLDAKPLRSLEDLKEIRSREGLNQFLAGLDWCCEPWRDSQKGAGIYAAMVLSGEADEAWEEWYFEWLWQEADPATGLWRKGAVSAAGDDSSPGAPLFHHLAGSFHYLFNQNYRKRPLRYPDRLADTCLELYAAGQVLESKEDFSFYELDVLYTTTGVMAQTTHRREELKRMNEEIGARFLAFLAERTDRAGEAVFPDLHTLCGAVCALAIVQSFMPEELELDRALQKVLDRRPFI